MVLKTDILEKLLSTPENAVEHLDLVYVDYRDFPILRLKKGEQFQYLIQDSPLQEKEVLERIDELVIPPAWQDVRITDKPNGHLQAVGVDGKKRRQYRYHPLWQRIRNQTKFYKLGAFGRALPEIRKQVQKDLELEGWPREKVMALVISLMEETHIRIGNKQYAERNNTYGLTTLRSRHLVDEGNRLRFEFTGKRGKKHRVTLRNKQLVRLVNRCEEIPGWELFKFFDENGKKQPVESGMVNAYLQQISSEYFTAKDFRTWGASLVFFEYLKDNAGEVKRSGYDKLLLRAYDAAAESLGNTRNVCRKYYVHPGIPAALENGQIEEYFRTAERKSNSDYFTANEHGMLQLIASYEPEIIPG